MPDDVTDNLRSLLNTKRGDYNKQVLAKHNDPTQSQSFVTAWSDDRVVVRGHNGTVTTKNAITNGAIGLGDPVTVRGNTANEMPVRRRQAVAEEKTAVKTKIGYVFSKTVTGSTAIVCASPVSGGGNVGGTAFGSVYVSYTETNSAGFSFTSPRSFLGGASVQPFLTSQSLNEDTFVFITGYGSIRQVTVTNQQTLQYGGGSFLLNLRLDRTYPDHPELDNWSQRVGAFDVVLPPPDSTPNPTSSFEFWYNGGKATVPIRLKKFASNQPLDAKPYIIHKSASLSYVVLKYGGAGNDGGSADDWCKMSLFEIVGTSDLTSSETIYSWTQAVSLETFLQETQNLFYAIAASKTKTEELDLAALVMAGKLNVKLQCFTHRNLTNLKLTKGLYLIDPITGEDSPLDDLVGEAVYTYGAIASNLVSLEDIQINLRYFDLKTNPNYTGSAENCTTNPAYKLIEKKVKRVKRVKVKGLGSADNTIKILTFNAGQI
ncbi:MAG: hypothetical protein KME42_13950 [Tildeniella nuda ZEHNDER 1965/U140]|jgi:hypothetical protein|nr:hypothetical protein [Tildeniella nuda ZEHNDER 1965/U140]